MGKIKHITIPENFDPDEDVPILSISGGKDSTAAALAMREAGIVCRYVFADTGWEAPQTYEHVDLLEKTLGVIIRRVGVPGGFKAQAVKEGILPHGKTAWCTRELKIKPIRAYHDEVELATRCDTVNVVGIRADESEARSKITHEYEFSKEWGGYVWRPILRWTVEDVLKIHHRHNIPVNPLYKLGFSRVGCAPCRNARKDEIRLWAQHFPERIAAVREIEKAVTDERTRRGLEGSATMFVLPEGPRPIDEVVRWSKTAKGGRQFMVLQSEPNDGCFRWGMCEPPAQTAETSLAHDEGIEDE